MQNAPLGAVSNAAGPDASSSDRSRSNGSGLVIACIVGTRPEAIKLAPLIRAIDATPGLDPFVISTGQHREMLEQALSLFEVTTDVDLALMRPGQRPAEVLAAAISKLTDLFADRPIDWVVVQGDTTTALAGALAASYAGIPVAHVEAGLRTGSIAEPFPEELNRRAIGSVASLHFPPTPGSAANLLREGVAPDDMVVTGNTVIDALLHVAGLGWEPPADHPFSQIPAGTDVVCVTAHRRENFGEPFAEACGAIRDLAIASGPKVQVVWPVHPNPQVGPVVRAAVGDLANVTLCDPLDYHELVWLLNRSRLVITDSGGIQEEAPSLGVPVLVMRDVTERPEAVDFGVVKLVGCDHDVILSNALRLLTDPAAHAEMASAVNPYGDGAASQRIVDRFLGKPVIAFDPGRDS